jgi:hypothetical protein
MSLLASAPPCEAIVPFVRRPRYTLVVYDGQTIYNPYDILCVLRNVRVCPAQRRLRARAPAPVPLTVWLRLLLPRLRRRRRQASAR